MNTTRIGLLSMGAIALVLVFGCERRRPITARDRKEAAHLVSEARFATSIREWARAEALYAKAVQVVPHGDYWLSLGATRLKLNNRAGAREAYRSALKAYEDDAARRNTLSEPWIKQAYVLALLGRSDDSRAVLQKAARHFPNDVKLRAFSDPKEYAKMLASQDFKDMAL